MLKKTFVGAVVAIVLAISLGGAAPAAATYPAGKIFAAFWEFNTGGGGFLSVFDCIRFTNNNRICSTTMGKCGPFEVTGTPTNSTSTWEARIQNTAFLGGGRVVLTGISDRRGVGGTGNATMIFKDLSSTFGRGNGSLDMHEDPGFFCVLPIPAQGPVGTLRDVRRRGTQKEETVPRD